MGSTGQSTTIVPSTYANASAGGSIAWLPVTSSGAYFQAGDTSQTIILIANASSSANGSVWIEPGSSKWPGSLGYAYSSGSTVYSTATAPLSVAVPLHGITGSSAIPSTTGSYVWFNLRDSDRYKSSDGKIFIVASTQSTFMYASVLMMIGGSSNAN